MTQRRPFRYVRIKPEVIWLDFVEDDHLWGNMDVVSPPGIFLREKGRHEKTREGRLGPLWSQHGHLSLDDRAKRTLLGHSAIRRLEGLAELRGVLQALIPLECRVLQ